MLQIKNLNLTHKKDLRVILSEFNLVLNKGDKAVIIGEEGNGKSTLMKWIYNPLLIDNYIEAEGERLVGKEILGYLPQEISEEDKEKTIYEFFSAEEMFWNRTPKELSEITGKFGMTRVAQDQDEYAKKEEKLRTIYGEKHNRFQELEALIQEKNDTKEILTNCINSLYDLKGEQTEFREELWGGLVDHIRVDSEKSSTVVFRGGIEVALE